MGEGIEEEKEGEGRAEEERGWKERCKRICLLYLRWPIALSALCNPHRVQETAMAAVRETIVSILNTGLRTQVAAVHGTCSPP